MNTRNLFCCKKTANQAGENCTASNNINYIISLWFCARALVLIFAVIGCNTKNIPGMF